MPDLEFTASFGIPEAAVERCTARVHGVFGYLGDHFGLTPDDFDVDTIRLLRRSEIEAIGDYMPGTIEMSVSLLPGVGHLYPGMTKAANARWENVFRHELGHAWQNTFMRRAKKIEPRFSLREVFTKAKPDAAQVLTKYSTKNYAEYFAEAFSAYTHPDFEGSGMVIESSLLSLFEEVIPRK